MKKIFSLLTILLLAGVVTAQTPDARKRVIITANNGQQTVYDVSKLRHVSFDKVEPVTASIELLTAAGFSVKVHVTVPEGCSRYQVAVAPADEQVGNWAEYIQSHASSELTASADVELGGLQELTAYVVAVLTYDRYGMASTVSTLAVSTVQATDAELPKVGYILYADGSWSRRMVKGRTPIGIIFSTTTSQDDQSRGWRHGYALALRNAAQQVKWAVTPAAHQVSDHYTSSDSLGFQTDKDGYAHTMALVNQGTGLYPAAEAAVAYPSAAPSHSSGWYLPSSGQWFDVCVNLGGLDTTMPVVGKTEGYWNTPQVVTNCLNLINEHMSLVGAANYEPIKVSSGDYQWFWSSSESGDQQAYAVFFDQDQLVVEIAAYFKNYGFSTNRVRPVIAF